MKITGSKEESEDIVQEVFLRLFERGRLENVTPTFLFLCVKNASLNYVQSARHNKRMVPIFPEMEIMSEDVQDGIEHMRQLERLDAAIETLPPKCKEVFCKVYLQEQKYEEVAEQLHISYHTVKAHMNMAFQLLKKKLLVLSFWIKSVKF